MIASPPGQSALARAPAPRRKGVLVFGVLAVLLAGLYLAAEAGVRVRQYLRYGTTATADQLYQVHQPSGLRVPIAGLHIGRITTDSRGFRNPELAVPKPAGRLRIAFLGSASTWCAEVHGIEHTWPHLVSSALAPVVAPARVDYVNAGVPGFGVKHSLANLKHRVAALEPDVIVIYHAATDLDLELNQLAATQGLKRAALGSPSSGWLSNHSVLWNLLEKNLAVSRAARTNTNESAILQVDVTRMGEAFRAGLTEIVKEASGVARLVVVPTFSTRLHPGQSAEEQSSAMASALLSTPFMTHEGLLRSAARYNEIIRSIVDETGALLVEGEHDITGSSAHFVDLVNFTDAGSAAMAERVVKALKNSPRFAAIAAERAASR